MVAEYEPTPADPDNDPYADHRETVGKYKEELEVFIQGQQDKKKKDKTDPCDEEKAQVEALKKEKDGLEE